MKKFLVTGAAGFIGAKISKSLLSEGHEVWTIDNLSTGKNSNIPQGVKFIESSCHESRSIRSLKGTKFDAILHFAGQSSGEISFDDPVYDLKTNTQSTLNLINYALKTKCKRFIYASSMSVYGNVPDKPIEESFECNPLSFYGVGKLASEHYLRIYASKGLQSTSLRLFNVFGSGQNLQNFRQGMVSIFIAQMILNRKIIVKGSLERYRDFIHVDDVVGITKAIIDNPITYNKIYNVGTGIRTTVKSLLDK